MIAKEVAKEDIERFLVAYRVDPIKRKKMDHLLPPIIELIENEMLVVNENGELEYDLIEPILDDAGEIKCSKLQFKNKRLRVEDMLKVDEIVKESFRIQETIHLITGVQKAYVNKFSVDDLGYINDITMLFLPVR